MEDVFTKILKQSLNEYILSKQSRNESNTRGNRAQPALGPAPVVCTPALQERKKPARQLPSYPMTPLARTTVPSPHQAAVSLMP